MAEQLVTIFDSKFPAFKSCLSGIQRDRKHRNPGSLKNSKLSFLSVLNPSVSWGKIWLKHREIKVFGFDISSIITGDSQEKNLVTVYSNPTLQIQKDDAVELVKEPIERKATYLQSQVLASISNQEGETSTSDVLHSSLEPALWQASIGWEAIPNEENKTRKYTFNSTIHINYAALAKSGSPVIEIPAHTQPGFVDLYGNEYSTWSAAKIRTSCKERNPPIRVPAKMRAADVLRIFAPLLLERDGEDRASSDYNDNWGQFNEILVVESEDEYDAYDATNRSILVPMEQEVKETTLQTNEVEIRGTIKKTKTENLKRKAIQCDGTSRKKMRPAGNRRREGSNSQNGFAAPTEPVDTGPITKSEKK